eukprot:TRINITY_DN10080_c0_g1_i1.p1 TRINITY_DN10080_c0_g1~~TRINITY_DN10080_c0_g1_i1.p1  ORF type:complete len:140 (+),score=16.72 TRINITY_DN10080_c0_g1_i1:629-1048(+)
MTGAGGGLALLLVALLGLLLRLLLGRVAVGLGSGGAVGTSLVVVEDLAAGVGTLLVVGIPGEGVLAKNTLHGVATDVLAVQATLTNAGTITKVCLLYTSDAADEEDSVDLGGLRISKKKKKGMRNCWRLKCKERLVNTA